MYKNFLILILILKEKISNIERYANFCLKYFSILSMIFQKFARIDNETPYIRILIEEAVFKM